MEQSGELVWRFLFQQEGQPDMGPEINSVDGVDAQYRETGRRILALGFHHRIADAHHRNAGLGKQQIGNGITRLTETKQEKDSL